MVLISQWVSPVGFIRTGNGEFPKWEIAISPSPPPPLATIGIVCCFGLHLLCHLDHVDGICELIVQLLENRVQGILIDHWPKSKICRCLSLAQCFIPCVVFHWSNYIFQFRPIGKKMILFLVFFIVDMLMSSVCLSSHWSKGITSFAVSHLSNALYLPLCIIGQIIYFSFVPFIKNGSILLCVSSVICLLMS